MSRAPAATIPIALGSMACSGRNAQLDGHAVRDDEYVNVYHSRRYIDRTWGRHFEMVEVLPGYLFTHDLVIMRRH